MFLIEIIGGYLKIMENIYKLDEVIWSNVDKKELENISEEINEKKY